MTQEDKELLLQDLCARLPHGVKMQKFNDQNIVIDLYAINLNNYTIDFYTYKGKSLTIANTSKLVRYGILLYKPYLFPLSSMTEEQKKEYRKVCELDTEILSKHPMDGTPFPALYNSQDWLNKNHFDYRGLIPKDLALDATGLNIY